MVKRRAAIGSWQIITVQSKRYRTSMFNYLNWQSLGERRKNIRLAIMCKQNPYKDIAIPIPKYIRRQNVTITKQYHPKKFITVATSNKVYEYTASLLQTPYPSGNPGGNRLPPSIRYRFNNHWKLQSWTTFQNFAWTGQK